MKNLVPVFFATDDNYVPFLSVTLKSLLDNSSKENFYKIHVLSTKLNEESKAKISSLTTDNSQIEFVSITEQLEKVAEKLFLRDYYSLATYYRFFIADMFPQYNKALYLDCDVVILDDVAKLYNTDIGTSYVGAIPDESVPMIGPFAQYVEQALGINRERYFNAGVMIMNLLEFRKNDIMGQFVSMMKKYKFTVAQDQDYLNVICKNKVHYIDLGWNKGAVLNESFNDEKLKLIHYNLNRKPWHNSQVHYSQIFWKYAQETQFYDEIKSILDNYTDEQRARDDAGVENLINMCSVEAENPNNYYKTYVKPFEPQKASDRLQVLDKINYLEKKGLWNQDVENDPETIPLTPDKVDYFHKKLSSKTKTFFINMIARKYINLMMRKDQLIIKDVCGIENFLAIRNQGAILTCNHFSAFDNFAVYKAIEKKLRRRTLYKVIREGNYTSMPGLYGVFFRNCNTLPLAANSTCMKNFLESISYHLKRGEKILIYPEQGMWWNYKKPRPMENGAFKFAAKNNCPILPIFITMEDSDKIGSDGFAIQEYTVHILPAIYPEEGKTSRENAEMLKNKNFEMWKEVYEETYGVTLTYDLDNTDNVDNGVTA